MTFPGRVTAPLLDVLEVLVRSYLDGSDIHGWALMKAAGRSGPTVYGVLDRLEDLSWVNGQWEESPIAGKPRLRLYRLTAHGIEQARTLLAARRP